MNKSTVFSHFFMMASLIIFVGCAAAPGKKVLREIKPSTTYKQQPEKTVEMDRKGSIWPDGGSKNLLFGDLKAGKVGDIITVKIIEKSNATKSATIKTSKDRSTDIGISKLFGLPLNLGMKDFIGLGSPFSPEIKGDYKTSLDGSGTTKRSGDFTAKITAQVIEVLPNDNLIIEGRKEVNVNNERQFIVLTGMIRPEDITPQNTIDSTYIADARIVYTGKGALNDKQSPGWLVRILDATWPF